MALQKMRIDSSSLKTNLLKELRGRMPVTEVSRRIGCGCPAWYKWENGYQFPTLPFIWRIEELISHIQGRAVSYREIWPHIDPSLEGLD